MFQEDTSKAGINGDVTDSYGPEVTTIYNLEPGGLYFYGVRDYSRGSSTELMKSGATIHVYRGKGRNPVYISEVPRGAGYYWNAFCISGDTGIMYPLDTITEEVLGV
nr:hypothetical protein [Eubacterium sp.]